MNATHSPGDCACPRCAPDHHRPTAPSPTVSDAEVEATLGAVFAESRVTADELCGPDLQELRETLARFKGTSAPSAGAKMGFYAPADFWEKLLAIVDEGP